MLCFCRILEANEYEGVMVKGPQSELITAAQGSGVVDWVTQWCRGLGDAVVEGTPHVRVLFGFAGAARWKSEREQVKRSIIPIDIKSERKPISALKISIISVDIDCLCENSSWWLIS
ncbi:unnamed protein product [Heligmosomoides polygyrus]|uniref:ATP-dependent DNA ligase family profile domain-containing protein n=1 Tax=Heligmosomoides polygyrus TaxID=6339 RepID=A0A183G4F4_HELPZ|nr:unnamed protein product [Heligmosomoides polygyrus]